MKVELRRINKHFGPVHANVDVSLTVLSGTIHGLLGENGAGKSTLVKTLTGFITRDSGEIVLDGQTVDIRTPSDALRCRIGMLHQDPLDFPPMTVVENYLAGSAGLAATGRGMFIDARAAARDLRSRASQFNFDIDPQALVRDLTVGERQQLEILRLLACGAGTLILDEPTTGISASQKSLLFSTLRKLAGDGMSIIFVSHKLEDVEELCDEVTVMRRGSVVGQLDLNKERLRGRDADDQVGGEKIDIASRIVAMMFGRELAPPSKPATRSAQVALKLTGLMLRDERLAIHIDDLSLYQGEVLGLAGLEGSGQPLLLLACAGLEHPVAGGIHLGGRNLTHRPYGDYLAAGVSYVPADRMRDGLIAGLTIQDHFALRLSAKGGVINRNETLAAAQQAIRTFNIRGKPDTPVERLSGGNQQRTELALMPSPLSVVLMEHPTRGLDIESGLYLWQQLIERCRQGTAIIFASSDLDEIVQYSDRVVVFSGGRVSAPYEAASLTVEQLGQMIGGKF
jgi:simple sugar transport system ATP-binding protein